MEVGSTGAERAVRVLLVEDSRTDAALVESRLEHSRAARFEVTVAGTLADGLARRAPDVILLDLTKLGGDTWRVSANAGIALGRVAADGPALPGRARAAMAEQRRSGAQGSASPRHTNRKLQKT